MLSLAAIWTPWIETATAWLLTYFLHSSLLLVTALLLVRALPERFLPAREIVWRTALVGGLLTATLQVGLAVSPLAGAWDLKIADRAATAPLIVRSETLLSEAVASSSPRLEVASQSLNSGAPLHSRAPQYSGTPLHSGTPQPPATSTRPWLTLVVAGWIGVATLLVTLLAASYLRLVRRLGSRRSIRRGVLIDILDRLVERAGAKSTHLARSDRITVPLARGIRRREICLPARMETEMSAERQEIVLAHELAHLERRDPAWLLGMRMLESVLFFQPLNRLARRELQEIAEFQCDDWAVASTGRPVTMARCLTDVAAWSLERRLPGLMPTMAVDSSRLGRRVSRLLSRDYPSPPVAAPRWLSVATFLVLILFVAVAPGVSRSASSDNERQIVVLSDEIGDSGEVAPSPEGDTVWVEASPVPDSDPSGGRDLGEPPTAPQPPSPSVAPNAVPQPLTDVPEPPVAPTPPSAPDVDPSVPHSAEIQVEVERALEGLDTDLQIEMEELHANLQVRLTELNIELEPLEKELEVLVAQVEAQFADIDPSQWSAEGLELPDPEAMARLEEITRRIGEAYQPTQEELRKLTELTAEIQEKVMVDVERALELAHEEQLMAREEFEMAREAIEMAREEIEMAREAAEMSREDFEMAREEIEEARTKHEAARQEAEEARAAAAKARESTATGPEDND